MSDTTKLGNRLTQRTDGRRTRPDQRNTATAGSSEAPARIFLVSFLSFFHWSPRLRIAICVNELGRLCTCSAHVWIMPSSPQWHVFFSLGCSAFTAQREGPDAEICIATMLVLYSNNVIKSEGDLLNRVVCLLSDINISSCHTIRLTDILWCTTMCDVEWWRETGIGSCSCLGSGDGWTDATHPTDLYVMKERSNKYVSMKLAFQPSCLPK